MDAHDLTRQTLEFASPIRVPRHMWTLPWPEEHFSTELQDIRTRFPDDIVWCPAITKQPLQVTGDPYAIGTYIDEWGCVFENRHRGIIGEVKDPLVKTWDQLDSVRLPEERLDVDVDQVNAFCRDTEQFVLSGCEARPFERLQFMRGTENVFIDLGEQRDELFTLLNRIHQLYLRELEIWAKTDVDALFFQDDWGAQQNLLISPRMWRKIFKPFYKDYVDLAHSHGKYAFMHSDGQIETILPDLIEIGLDAINSQLFCMDIERLGEQFAGKITFWGEIDRQQILPLGTVEDVTHAVHRVKNALYSNGGVIAQCSFGVGVIPTNVHRVFEVWEALFALE